MLKLNLHKSSKLFYEAMTVGYFLLFHGTRKSVMTSNQVMHSAWKTWRLGFELDCLAQATAGG